MKYTFSKATVTAMLLLGMQLTSNISFAQVSPTDKAKLTEVSRIDAIDGDADFLIAELLKDGLLQEKERIYIQYSNKTVSLNGRDVPEPNKSRYMQMLKNGGFLSDGEGTGSIRADGQTISKVTGENNTHLHGGHSYHHNYERLARMLVEDGIADSADNMTIDIAADYVAVNGRILTTPIEKAYEYHFRDLSGFKPKEGEVMSILIKHSSKK